MCSMYQVVRDHCSLSLLTVLHLATSFTHLEDLQYWLHDPYAYTYNAVMYLKKFWRKHDAKLWYSHLLFVLFHSVYCSCVHVYYCHRVSTQLQLTNISISKLISTVLVIFAHSVTTVTSNLYNYVYSKYSCKYTCMHQHVPQHFIIFVIALHSWGCL